MSASDKRNEIMRMRLPTGQILTVTQQLPNDRRQQSVGLVTIELRSLNGVRVLVTMDTTGPVEIDGTWLRNWATGKRSR